MSEQPSEQPESGAQPGNDNSAAAAEGTSPGAPDSSAAGQSSAPESGAGQESNAAASETPASEAAPSAASSAAVSQPSGPESPQQVASAKSHRSSSSATEHKSRTGQSRTDTPSSQHTNASSGARSQSPVSRRERMHLGELNLNNASSGARSQSPVSRRKRMRLGELNLDNAKIGFVGAGKMTESIINGLIHYAKISPKMIHVAAPSSRGLEKFKGLGCHVSKRNYDIFGRYDCDIVFLSFHGHVIKHCYKLGGPNRPHPLTTNYIPHQRHPIYILSLVSGVSLSQIRACLLNPESANRYVVEMHRIMMNTAVGHGLGICAIDCEADSRKLSAPIRSLLSKIAQLEMVPGAQMDAACAAGGSGLAFAYYFIHALADGATKMGLSRAQAIRFASKTAQCAAQTMLESAKHPAELRDLVSSPSGAAIYGIHVLDKNDVASGVSAAVEAAHKRLSDLATQDVDKA